MEIVPKLTTTLACRVARIDRDRFNEAVASGHFNCAPETTPGRARIFHPEDMIALWLYRELLDDGYRKDFAGQMACAVSSAARRNPNAPTITFLQGYFGPGVGEAVTADRVPNAETWSQANFDGTDIRKTTTFNIQKLRELISFRTE
jgi:hypothetical protein